MKNSLAYSFSNNKVNMLKKMGYSVKASDMRKPFKPILIRSDCKTLLDPMCPHPTPKSYG
jgi:hypothetical protein